MFLLFFNIDHVKLIKRNSKKDYENLKSDTRSIIRKWGGVVDDGVDNLSIHPDGYPHSKIWLYNCINEITDYLKKCDFLTGFTILIKKVEKIDKEIMLDEFKTMNLGVFSINSVWAYPDILQDLGLSQVEKRGDLVSINTPILIPRENELVLSIDHKISETGLNSYKLDYIIDYKLINSLYKWAESKGVCEYLFFSYNNSFISKILFIKYLLTKIDKFNPLTDLDEIEIEKWDIYLELFKSFASGDVSAYVLDSPELHLNKLIYLWIESFCKRFRTLLILKTPKDEYFPYSFYVNNLIVLRSEEKVAFVDYSKTIEELDNKVLRILYYVCVTDGYLDINELVELLRECSYSYIDVVDIIQFLKVKGLIWGDTVLYPHSNKVFENLLNKENLNIDKWRRELIQTLKSYSKDFIIKKLLMNLDSDIDSSLVREYLDLYLDMGKEEKGIDSLNNSYLQYYNRKSSRVIYKKVLNTENSVEDKYLDIQDVWTKGVSESLVSDSKKLYMEFQQHGEIFNEAKSKILFSLCLLSVGRIDESIDYLELNTTYSLGVNDRFSYIRSSCFLMSAMINKGNLTGVIRVFNNLSQYKWVKLKTKWYLYALFLVTRAYGELGEYKEAVRLLDNAIKEAQEKSYKDIRRVLHNWSGLYKAYSGEIIDAVEEICKMDLSSESYLFLSYIEYFRGDNNKSLEYIIKAKEIEDVKDLFDEDIVWRDGCFIVEEFCLRNREKSILLNEIDNFYFFISSKTGSDKISELKEVVDNIPNESLFIKDYKALFFIYMLLENKNSFDTNLEKLIDKSIRLIQLRGNNIDSHNKKADYYKNYWNKIIMNYKS